MPHSHYLYRGTILNGKLNVGGNERVTIDGLKVKEKLKLFSYNGNNPIMLWKNSVTIPQNTVLKSDLQIENGVAGEDLVDTANTQTAAVEELLRMVNRKVADHNGEGQYVWKKYKVEGEDIHIVCVTGNFIKSVVGRNEYGLLIRQKWGPAL